MIKALFFNSNLTRLWGRLNFQGNLTAKNTNDVQFSITEEEEVCTTYKGGDCNT